MHIRSLEAPERRADEPKPSPPPLHVLLALQRTAGNHAVTRMLARAKYKPSQVKSEVKSTMKSEAPTNKVGLLLAIYNEMRFSLDPQPDKFTTVKTATTT